MGKKQKQSHQQQACCLVLKGSKGSYYPKKIQANYWHPKYRITMPKYNCDGKYYTPSFIVPAIMAENSVDYQAQHLKKVQGTFEKSQHNILVPRPRLKKKNYCAVCRRDYVDYLEHINHAEHKVQLKNEKFHQEILTLCLKIQARNAQARKNLNMQVVNSKMSLLTETNSDEELPTKQQNHKNEPDFKQVYQHTIA